MQVVVSYSDGQYHINGDINSLIESIDPIEFVKFVKSLFSEDCDWTLKCYWDKMGKSESTPFYSGCWVVYSFLISKEHLLIENEYYGRYPQYRNKYCLRESYHNGFENSIYKPFLQRMVDLKYLNFVKSDGLIGSGYYSLGGRCFRDEKISSIGI
jgi:hypothetical protein